MAEQRLDHIARILAAHGTGPELAPEERPIVTGDLLDYFQKVFLQATAKDMLVLAGGNANLALGALAETAAYERVFAHLYAINQANNGHA